MCNNSCVRIQNERTVDNSRPSVRARNVIIIAKLYLEHFALMSNTRVYKYTK